MHDRLVNVTVTINMLHPAPSMPSCRLQEHTRTIVVMHLLIKRSSNVIKVVLCTLA